MGHVAARHPAAGLRDRWGRRGAAAEYVTWTLSPILLGSIVDAPIDRLPDAIFEILTSTPTLSLLVS